MDVFENDPIPQYQRPDTRPVVSAATALSSIQAGIKTRVAGKRQAVDSNHDLDWNLELKVDDYHQTVNDKLEEISKYYETFASNEANFNQLSSKYTQLENQIKKLTEEINQQTGAVIENTDVHSRQTGTKIATHVFNKLQGHAITFIPERVQKMITEEIAEIVNRFDVPNLEQIVEIFANSAKAYNANELHQTPELDLTPKVKDTYTQIAQVRTMIDSYSNALKTQGESAEKKLNMIVEKGGQDLNNITSSVDKKFSKINRNMNNIMAFLNPQIVQTQQSQQSHQPMIEYETVVETLDQKIENMISQVVLRRPQEVALIEPQCDNSKIIELNTVLHERESELIKIQQYLRGIETVQAVKVNETITEEIKLINGKLATMVTSHETEIKQYEAVRQIFNDTLFIPANVDQMTSALTTEMVKKFDTELVSIRQTVYNLHTASQMAISEDVTKKFNNMMELYWAGAVRSKEMVGEIDKFNQNQMMLVQKFTNDAESTIIKAIENAVSITNTAQVAVGNLHDQYNAVSGKIDDMGKSTVDAVTDFTAQVAKIKTGMNDGSQTIANTLKKVATDCQASVTKVVNNAQAAVMTKITDFDKAIAAINKKLSVATLLDSIDKIKEKMDKLISSIPDITDYQKKLDKHLAEFKKKLDNMLNNGGDVSRIGPPPGTEANAADDDPNTIKQKLDRMILLSEQKNINIEEWKKTLDTYFSITQQKERNKETAFQVSENLKEVFKEFNSKLTNIVDNTTEKVNCDDLIKQFEAKIVDNDGNKKCETIVNRFEQELVKIRNNGNCKELINQLEAKFVETNNEKKCEKIVTRFETKLAKLVAENKTGKETSKKNSTKCEEILTNLDRKISDIKGDYDTNRCAEILTSVESKISDIRSDYDTSRCEEILTSVESKISDIKNDYDTSRCEEILTSLERKISDIKNVTDVSKCEEMLTRLEREFEKNKTCLPFSNAIKKIEDKLDARPDDATFFDTIEKKITDHAETITNLVSQGINSGGGNNVDDTEVSALTTKVTEMLTTLDEFIQNGGGNKKKKKKKKKPKKRSKRKSKRRRNRRSSGGSSSSGSSSSSEDDGNEDSSSSEEEKRDCIDNALLQSKLVNLQINTEKHLRDHLLAKEKLNTRKMIFSFEENNDGSVLLESSELCDGQVHDEFMAIWQYTIDWAIKNPTIYNSTVIAELKSFSRHVIVNYKKFITYINNLTSSGILHKRVNLAKKTSHTNILLYQTGPSFEYNLRPVQEDHKLKKIDYMNDTITTARGVIYYDTIGLNYYVGDMLQFLTKTFRFPAGCVYVEEPNTLILTDVDGQFWQPDNYSLETYGFINFEEDVMSDLKMKIDISKEPNPLITSYLPTVWFVSDSNPDRGQTIIILPGHDLLKQFLDHADGVLLQNVLPMAITKAVLFINNEIRKLYRHSDTPIINGILRIIDVLVVLLDHIKQTTNQSVYLDRLVDEVQPKITEIVRLENKKRSFYLQVYTSYTKISNFREDITRILFPD